MKLAARFPVTSFKPLIVVVVLFHGLLMSIAFIGFGFAWQQLLIITGLTVSVYFTYKQYQKITQASDDLCWNGQSWLMAANKSSAQHQGREVIYLKVSANSWLTSQLSLLHFNSDKENFSWLFSKAELGERLYSHLVYLVRQDLKQNIKEIRKLES